MRDPLLADEARLDAGRLPSGEDEVLLSPGLAEQLGDLRPGAAITADDGTQLTVSGLASDRFCFACDQVVTLPGSRAARLTPESAPELAETDWVDYLIDLPDDVAAESAVARARRARRRSHARGTRTCTPSATTPAASPPP